MSNYIEQIKYITPEYIEQLEYRNFVSSNPLHIVINAYEYGKTCEQSECWHKMPNIVVIVKVE